MSVIALSGGFDPVHIGHLAMIDAAAELGSVVILLNSDAWLVRKKGYIFQAWEDRAKILSAMSKVHAVVECDDADGTVCATLAVMRPAMFGNGGDRTNDNTPELQLCRELGIRPIFGLGGDKQNNSSAIARRAK